jgi:hypothetical protein
MHIGFKHIGVTLLFIVGTGNAFANSSGKREYDGYFTRFFQMQRVAVERGEQRNDSRMAAPDERRHGGELDRHDNGDFANQSGNSSSHVNDNSRKQGRLSPEERRALRRQIDEAGHDIYRPKR